MSFLAIGGNAKQFSKRNPAPSRLSCHQPRPDSAFKQSPWPSKCHFPPFAQQLDGRIRFHPRNDQTAVTLSQPREFHHPGCFDTLFDATRNAALPPYEISPRHPASPNWQLDAAQTATGPHASRHQEFFRHSSGRPRNSEFTASAQPAKRQSPSIARNSISGRPYFCSRDSGPLRSNSPAPRYTP